MYVIYNRTEQTTTKSDKYIASIGYHLAKTASNIKHFKQNIVCKDQKRQKGDPTAKLQSHQAERGVELTGDSGPPTLSPTPISNLCKLSSHTRVSSGNFVP